MYINNSHNFLCFNLLFSEFFYPYLEITELYQYKVNHYCNSNFKNTKYTTTNVSVPTEQRSLLQKLEEETPPSLVPSSKENAVV